jgi:hypothetical protein
VEEDAIMEDEVQQACQSSGAECLEVHMPQLKVEAKGCDLAAPKKEASVQCEKEDTSHREREMLLLEERARRALAEAERLEAGARQAEASAKTQEAAAQQRVAEAERMVAEARKLEAEAQDREAEVSRREEEASRKDEKVRRLSTPFIGGC